MKGKIVRWFDRKGYGFIEVEEKEKDIFVHTNDFEGTANPKIGDIVEFEVKEDYKGLKAVNVKIE